MSTIDYDQLLDDYIAEMNTAGLSDGDDLSGGLQTRSMVQNRTLADEITDEGSTPASNDVSDVRDAEVVSDANGEDSENVDHFLNNEAISLRSFDR